MTNLKPQRLIKHFYNLVNNEIAVSDNTSYESKDPEDSSYYSGVADGYRYAKEFLEEINRQ